MIIHLSNNLTQKQSVLYTVDAEGKKLNFGILKQKFNVFNRSRLLDFSFLNFEDSSKEGDYKPKGKMIVNNTPKLQVKGKLEIGEGVELDSSKNRVEIVVEVGAELFIGENTKIIGAEIFANNKITIGNNCEIGAHCIVMDDDFLPHASSAIEIGDNVIIGERSVILSGVKIGSGAKILPGAVVTKNIDAGMIFPAKKQKVSSSKVLKIGSLNSLLMF